MTQIKNFGTEKTPYWLTTTTIVVNGEEKEIIPAVTGYTMKRIDFSKDDTFKELDKSMILPTLFCFSTQDCFTKENIKLYDLNGKELENLPDGIPEIMVILERTDNINLLEILEGPLKAEIIPCLTVEEAYKRVATTAYLSGAPSKEDWIGYAAAVSTESILKLVRSFCNDYNMNGTTAQGYFGLNTKSSVLKAKAVATNTTPFKGGFRSMKQAKELFDATIQAFGARAAKQTRYIKAINYCISTYGFDTIVTILNSIKADAKLQLEATACENKVACLQGLIIEQATLQFNTNKQKRNDVHIK